MNKKTLFTVLSLTTIIFGIAFVEGKSAQNTVRISTGGALFTTLRNDGGSELGTNSHPIHVTGGGSGISNPLPIGTSPPALYNDSAKGGMAFDINGLPSLLDLTDGVSVALTDDAGVNSNGPGVNIIGHFPVIGMIGTQTSAPIIELAGFSDQAEIYFQTAGGSFSSPSVAQSLGDFVFNGRNELGGYSTGANITVTAAEDFSTNHAASILGLRTTNLSEANDVRIQLDALGNTEILNGNLLVGSNFTITASGDITASGLATGTPTSFLCRDAGNKVITNGSACVVSGRRFKRDIVPLVFDDMAIMRLIPVHFRMKPEYEGPRGNVIREGLIAEDVAENLPRCAIYDTNGLVQSWDESCMIAHLVQIVQQQQMQINILKMK